MTMARTPVGVRTVRDRWIGIGHSTASDPRRAGVLAAADALEGEDAALLVVFCSDAYDLDLLLGGIRERSGETPLIGCSTAGEIATGGPGDAGVVVMALGGTGFSVSTRAAACEPHGLRGAGAHVAACLRDVEERPTACYSSSRTAWPETSRRSFAAPTASSARVSRWSVDARATT